MAKEAQLRIDSLTPWTLTFSSLDKPTTISESSREVPKFHGNFELDKDSSEVKRFRAAIVETARMLWPNLDVGAAIREKRLNIPMHDGDGFADRAKAENENPGHKKFGKNLLREWSRGKMVLIARSKDEYPPTVTIRENGKTVLLETLDAVARAKGKFLYIGVQVLYAVKLEAYEGVPPDGKPGVTAYLEQVESLGTGERFIAQKDRTERFRGYIGLEQDHDPTGASAGGDW